MSLHSSWLMHILGWIVGSLFSTLGHHCTTLSSRLGVGKNRLTTAGGRGVGRFLGVTTEGHEVFPYSKHVWCSLHIYHIYICNVYRPLYHVYIYMIYIYIYIHMFRQHDLNNHGESRIFFLKSFSASNLKTLFI